MKTVNFQKFCTEFFKSIQEYAPKDTHNLADNALQLRWLSNDVCQIFVDESIAPYMPFTNEIWVSPKWNGKQNPNEHWWNDIFMVTANELATKYNGVLGYGNHYVIDGQIQHEAYFNYLRQTRSK
jgi:hypothetical protein